MTSTADDNFYMKLALKEAQKSIDSGDVPIGVVIVFENRVLSTGHNQVEKNGNPLAHAEILAINKATKKLGYKHLLKTKLYVTLEPCSMCAGAIVLARIPELIIGTNDTKTGACGSLYNITNDSRLNHRLEIRYNVLQSECSYLLKDFFNKLRIQKNAGTNQRN